MIYALDKMLDIEAGVSIKEFLKVANGYILAQGMLVSLYGD